MRDQKSLALPPRAQRRNRRLFSLAVGTFIPALTICTGVLMSHPRPATLLVALDEISLSNGSSAGRDSTRSATSASTHQIKQAALQFPVVGNLVALTEGTRAFMTQAVATGKSSVADSKDKSDSDLRWFNGRPIRPARTMHMTVTAYSPDERSCGASADGITASGYSVWTNGMKMAAADTRVLPFGTLISVPGYDHENPVPVLDRGGAIKGHRLDMLYPTDQQARNWGVQNLEITIWEYADGQPDDFKTQYTLASR